MLMFWIDHILSSTLAESSSPWKREQSTVNDLGRYYQRRGDHEL
jgi:hypothetical protein